MHLFAAEPAVPRDHLGHRKVGSLLIVTSRVDIEAHGAAATIGRADIHPVDELELRAGIRATHHDPVRDRSDVAG